MVGNEFNDKVIKELFEETLLLEGLRLLVSWAATRESCGVGTVTRGDAASRRKGIMIADVSRAFFESPSKTVSNQNLEA